MTRAGMNTCFLDDRSNQRISSILTNATTPPGSSNADAKMPYRTAMLNVQRDAVVFFGFFLDDWSNRIVRYFGSVSGTLARGI